MGRLKANLSRNQLDRDLHTHVADAQKSLERALEACRAAASQQGPGLRDRGIDHIQDTLKRANTSLNWVGHLNEPKASEDTDLLSEDEHSARAAARRAKAKPLVERVVIRPKRAIWEEAE